MNTICIPNYLDVHAYCPITSFNFTTRNITEVDPETGKDTNVTSTIVLGVNTDQFANDQLPLSRYWVSELPPCLTVDEVLNSDDSIKELHCHVNDTRWSTTGLSRDMVNLWEYWRKAYFDETDYTLEKPDDEKSEPHNNIEDEDSLDNFENEDELGEV